MEPDPGVALMSETALWLPGGAPSQIGQYRLVRPLGQGGVGAVFEARHLLLNQRVAVKVLHAGHAADPRSVARFRREMTAFGRVPAHPNLIGAQYAGEEGGLLYLVMDYVDGADLSGVMGAHGPFLAPAACEAIRQAALGLEAVRRAGLVHRDLKPANLILASDGSVKILDLGLARALEAELDGDELTQSHVLMGTFDFQSPEQAADPRAVDVRADIYSLGCTLYKLITGRVPFTGCKTPTEKIAAHAAQPFPLLGDTPGELDAVLGRMTAKDPADRFATPAALAEALRPFSSAAALSELCHRGSGGGAGSLTSTLDTPGPSNATSATTRPARLRANPGRRRYRWAAVGGIASLLAGAVAYSATRPPERPAPPDALVRIDAPPIGPPAPGDPILAAGATARNLDALPPNEMHDLLAQAPNQIVWEPGNGTPSRTYDAGLRQLTVTTARPALFQLGAITKPSFEWQITISQATWTKGGGVYFGFRPSPAVPGQSLFQYLLFTPKADDTGRRALVLTRGHGRLSISPAGPVVGLDAEVSAAIVIPIQEGLLSLEVHKWRLSKVRFNGIELDNLLTLNKDFAEADHRGGLGILTSGSSCVYRKTYLTPFRDP